MYRAINNTVAGVASNGGTKTLRYALDGSPGYSRRLAGARFRYFDSHGKRIQNRAVLSRLEALRIPPAWTAVWICPHENGHLQATGRDQRGRKQYRYHESWTSGQSALKYDHILEFADSLPRIRSRVARDFAKPGLPKEKVLAAVLRLMENTLIRVGNEQYARENRSYGLTTLRDRHASVRAGRIRLRFFGKGNKWHECEIRDDRLCVVRQCQELPGQQLLQYVDQIGVVRDITSSDVNDYLRSITGHAFTAKEFRTWSATSFALLLLSEAGDFASERAAKRKIVGVIDRVAERLNNTRAVCRKSYVHPGILAAFLDQSLPGYVAKASRYAHRSRQRGLSGQERLTREVLNQLATASGRSASRGRSTRASVTDRNARLPAASKRRTRRDDSRKRQA